LQLITTILSIPYAFILWLRHKCYDWGIWKHVSFDFPVLSIGNITVGGTGKTPHTELILRLFSKTVPMAVLSAGYKRTSKGFRYVTISDSVSEAGDEPLQIKRKFPEVVVAVNKNRIAAINRIRQDHPEVRLIVLDDAFQYRKLKPSYSILLSDYHRPYTKDQLLPFGRLRDLPSQASRADMIIVTKTPQEISSEERENQMKILKPKPNQHLLFSRYTYGCPSPLYPCHLERSERPPTSAVIAITSIASPSPFLQEISKHTTILKHLKFPDHHNFTKNDILQINSLCVKHPGIPIFTTEKDAIRLLESPTLSQDTKTALRYIPVQVEWCSTSEHCQFIDVTKKLFN